MEIESISEKLQETMQLHVIKPPLIASIPKGYRLSWDNGQNRVSLDVNHVGDIQAVHTHTPYADSAWANLGNINHIAKEKYLWLHQLEEN
jgi:hypothetical protein